MISSYNASAKEEEIRRFTKFLKVCVVNQYSDEVGKLILNNPEVKVVNKKSTGLSKNRNTGLEIFSNNHIIICDDDIEINENVFSSALDEIDKLFYDGYGFVTFNNADVSGPRFKNFQHTKFSVMKIPSWCICLRSDIASAFRFDESFGINAKYNSGEENILLFDILMSGVRGAHINIDPVRHIGESTGHIWNIDLAKAKGALFHRTYGSWVGLFITILFMLKKVFTDRASIKLLGVAIREYSTHR
ncbi:glycosyltransferase [Roseivivax sp. THAF197b]|uniref:glycosyltransferase n=1 Tax=Roseivivax sp. THAF197b TaxID=2588299 RepID=UPI001561ED45|nr:glycosyltransferase [Roseivivax sp. THAF197b]